MARSSSNSTPASPQSPPDDRAAAARCTCEDLDAALIALGSAPTHGHGPISDHASDALLTAAWMRCNADRPELWHPVGLTPRIAATEGWTFGVT